MHEPIQLPELRQCWRAFSVLYDGLLIQEPVLSSVGQQRSVGDDKLLKIHLDVSSWFKVESGIPVEHFRFKISASGPSIDTTCRVGDVLSHAHNPVSLEDGVNWVRRLGPWITSGIYMEEAIPPLDEAAVTRLLANLADQLEREFEGIRREAAEVREFFARNRNWQPAQVAVSPA